jgi:hypothetical protein
VNDLAINAIHAATALGRQIPKAEASTWLPSVDAQSADIDPAGLVVLVTADTMVALGGGYVVANCTSAAFAYDWSNFFLGCSDAVSLGGTRYVMHDTGVMGRAALTPALAPAVSQTRQTALISAVRSIFSNAKISVSSHSDEEEGWTRPLLQVETGITDSEKLSALEEKFYQYVDLHETLKAALDSTTVLFE